MPNKIYVADEATISFKSTGGDVTFTPTSLASGAGRVSAQWDRGAGSRPATFLAQVRTKVASTPAVGKLLEVYLASGDGTYVAGGLGTADAAVSAGDKRRNLRWLMNLQIDKADSAEVFVARRRVYIPDRYVSILWWSAVEVALSGTAGDHEFALTPIPDEIQ